MSSCNCVSLEQLLVRAGFVPDEFIVLARKEDASQKSRGVSMSSSKRWPTA